MLHRATKHLCIFIECLMSTNLASLSSLQLPPNMRKDFASVPSHPRFKMWCLGGLDTNIYILLYLYVYSYTVSFVEAFHNVNKYRRELNHKKPKHIESPCMNTTIKIQINNRSTVAEHTFSTVTANMQVYTSLTHETNTPCWFEE